MQDTALRELIMDKIGVHYDLDKTKDIISTAYNQLRDIIKSRIRDRLISLKIDATTKYLKSFLGINAQIIWNQKIVVITLGVVRLECQHTSFNLKVQFFQLNALSRCK